MAFGFVLSAALLGLAVCVPRSEAAQLRATGTVLHGTGTTAYLGRLRGVTEIALGPSQAALTLTPGGCFVTLTWALAGATDGRTTLGVETCITAPAMTGADLDAFMDGQASADPSLSFPVVPGATPPVVTNPTTVAAQLFLRGCTGSAYRKHADLVFAPGAIQLLPFTDTAGTPQVDLLPTAASLVNPDAALWTDVLADCRGTDRMLPTSPSAGATSDLAGTTVAAPGPPGPHEDIAQLARDVADLATSAQLLPGYAASLTRVLDKAATKLRAGKAKKAIKKMTGFTRKVDGLVARSLLPAPEGQALIDGGAAVAADITALAFSGPVRVLPVICPPPAPCAATVYQVRAGAGGVPDGTLAHPFPAIAAALAAAEASDLCGVELQVADGTYADDLVITRDTAIFGASRSGVHVPATILNQGPHELNLARLVIDGSSILGAVVVDDPCATTTLADVRIEDAKRWGLWQKGGTVEAVGLTVRRTGATGGDAAYGTGVLLGAGVAATLVDLELRDNEGGGLLATDIGTDVSVHGLVARDNRVNAFFVDDVVDNVIYGGAGVRASAGAVLAVHAGEIAGNENFGLLVDNGATATFEHGTIDGTRQVAGERGYNALSIHAASLELIDFVSENSELAGIGIAHAEADAHEGEVSGCPIGVVVSCEDFDVGRLTDGVIYRDNDRNLDSTALPVPEALGGV